MEILAAREETIGTRQILIRKPGKAMAFFHTINMWSQNDRQAI